MKRIVKIGLILLLTFSFFYMTFALDYRRVTSKATAAEEAMVTIFENSGAEILEANITSTLEVPYTIWSREEILQIKEELKKELGLNNQKEVPLLEEDQLFYEEEMTEEDYNKLFIHEFSDIGVNQIIATNRTKTGDVLTFKVYSADLQGEKTSYIIIDIIQNKRYKDIVEQSNQSQELLRKYGNRIDTTINLVGTYKGKMSEQEKKKKIDEIIYSVEGKIVEEVISESYSSVTLYTPCIQQAIEYDEKRVNLHLAMRYNHYEDKTYLYIANPLITLTY